MEKRKNNQAAGPSIFRLFVACLAAIIVMLCASIAVGCAVIWFVFGRECLGAITNCSEWGEDTSTSQISTSTPFPRQPGETVSYTQSLMDHPLLPPEFLHIVPSIPYDGETATVCVLVDTAHFKTGTHSFSIDWVTVKDKDITVGPQSEPMREICAHVRVRPGLYLMRFTALYTTDGDLDYLSHRWAVEIK